MNSGADVQSIAALREWLAAAHTYREECEESLSGIRLEIRRGIDWVEQQLRQWESVVRQCEEEVVQAKAELAARKFPDYSGRMPDTTVQERNLRRARARLEYAQEKIVVCRRWIVQLPKMIDEVFTAAGHRLGTFLEGDFARGLALLARQIEALERYSETRADFAPAPSSAALASPLPPPSDEAGAPS